MRTIKTLEEAHRIIAELEMEIKETENMMPPVKK